MTDNRGSSASEPPKRILIVLLGAIGDVVRALPLLGRMRRAWPLAHIAWAVEPKSRPLLEGHPWLDQLIVYERTRAPWSFAPFLIEVRHGHFDLVLDLQRHLKSGLASLVSRAPERLGFSATNTKELNHWFSSRTIGPQPRMRLKLAQYLTFADRLELPPTPVEFGLRPSSDESRRVRALLADAPQPRLAVILGSSWPSRVYFPEAVAAVVHNLAAPADHALFPILVGGPEELALAAEVTRYLGSTRCLNLAGRTGLRDLFALFEECSAAFGPDSGPMHIAAAMGCPVVSLWGATAPARSAPWGFADFALAAEIPCHPCYLRRCPIGRECMRRIAPEEVAAALRRALVTVHERPVEASIDAHESARDDAPGLVIGDS
ncbi:MAG: glycosyltransferase family 9 protein [Candidatus Binataceae bacterium]